MSYKTPQPHDSTSQLQINRAESEGPSKALSPEDLFNNQNLADPSSTTTISNNTRNSN